MDKETLVRVTKLLVADGKFKALRALEFALSPAGQMRTRGQQEITERDCEYAMRFEAAAAMKWAKLGKEEMMRVALEFDDRQRGRDLEHENIDSLDWGNDD